ncbi:M48 family metallopeptidase [Nocardioides sp. YIM 152588]|uniref:M48 family metallopeptidase n=1 Tax=Nocardioides sp. YIM 152588 TaxID=3158259 RepID=UPI0032E4FCDD
MSTDEQASAAVGDRAAGGPRPAGRVAAVTLAVGAVAFVALAAWLVPWQPVPGGTPAPVPADSVFTAAQIDRAESYATWARVWSWSGLAVSLVVACWLGFSRTGRRWAGRVPGRWWLRVVLLVAAVSLAGWVATAPFRIGLRSLQLREGLATSSWGAWARDQLVSEAVTVAVTSFALVLAVGCARRWRAAWPAVLAAVLGVAVLLGSYAYPVLIEPLFNSFEPLPAGHLRSAILDLADQEGVAVDDVLVADASRRTTALNAYVSGFGDTRRVVVYDNLVDQRPEDEVLSVVAHELAHAGHDDVLVGTVLGVAGVVAGTGLLALLLLGWERRGVVRLRDGTAVPAVLALVAVAGVVAAPVQNGISREVETRADVVALRTTGDSASFVALQKELALANLSDPTPPRISQWWFGSHPTVLERVALASRIGGAGATRR